MKANNEAKRNKALRDACDDLVNLAEKETRKKSQQTLAHDAMRRLALLGEAVAGLMNDGRYTDARGLLWLADDAIAELHSALLGVE